MDTSGEGAARAPTAVQRQRPRMWGALAGLAVTVLLVVVAFALPPLAGWDVAARSTSPDMPPLHGYWDPGFGAATVLASA